MALCREAHLGCAARAEEGEVGHGEGGDARGSEGDGGGSLQWNRGGGNRRLNDKGV